MRQLSEVAEFGFVKVDARLRFIGVRSLIKMLYLYRWTDSSVLNYSTPVFEAGSPDGDVPPIAVPVLVSQSLIQ